MHPRLNNVTGSLGAKEDVPWVLDFLGRQGRGRTLRQEGERLENDGSKSSAWQGEGRGGSLGTGALVLG